MKKNLLLILCLFLTTLTVHATSLKFYPKDIAYLGNLDLVTLNNVENNQLTVFVAYPGQISNNCSLLMRTASGTSLKPLLDRLIITMIGATPPVTEVKGTLIYRLALESFLAGITIQTKDGKSIAENVHAAFPPQGSKNRVDYNDVGLQAGVCHRKFPT